MLGCIIQARMGSSRLPGKIMKKLDKTNTILDFVINQTRNSRTIKKIVIATTNLPNDDIVEKFCKEKNILCFRGNENDVLDRYYQCAKKFSLDPIVRITADNPMIDPRIIDLAIEKFNENDFDLVTTCHSRSFPYGISVEIFSFDALKKSWRKSKLQSEREHVVLYMHNNKNSFKIYDLLSSKNFTYINCSIDNENDFSLVKKVVSKIKERPILMKHLIEIFQKNPELLEINKSSDPYEGHKKSFKKDKIK